ncbi:hypothetical protein U1Q18_013988 [Sarracenia purpurea var. burkii]
MHFGSNLNEKQESFDDCKGLSSGDDVEVNSLKGVNLLAEKVNTVETNCDESMETGNNSLSSNFGLKAYLTTGLQPLEHSEIGASSETKLADSNTKFSMEAALQGKPTR